MNIFVLHKKPKECVKLYCDQHVRKMILETAQLLSFAHYEAGTKLKYHRIYKDSKGHHNHPCAKWLYRSQANYRWLVKLGMYLCKEYTFRFNKTHATQKVMVYLKNHVPDLPDVPITQFELCMPKQYHFISVIRDRTVFRDTIKSYKRYYRAEKQTFKRGPAVWTKRDKPDFLIPIELFVPEMPWKSPLNG